MKKKILWVSEASFLATGFSTYTLEILRRLYDTGKYDITELGCYVKSDDPRQQGIPWKFYGSLPTNPTEEQIYHSKQTNQFGEWKFESVCLDVKPNIVVDMRDNWMVEFITRSPYRKYFKWAYMSCPDSANLQPDWVDNYLNADALLSYTDWGLNLCNAHSGDRCKTIAHVGAGPDTNLFQPVPDKRAHKVNCGLDPDSFIIMSVMRNQKRKLFPDVIFAFSEFLKNCDPEIAAKSFLYLHTSFPDVGWKLNSLLQQYKVANKVLFTYQCRNCHLVFPSFFKDALTFCPRCKALAASIPNTGLGIPREALPAIYNLADVYVQYSIAGALEVPLLEACSCCVPSISTDYAGMGEVIQKCGGIPIKIQKHFYESETGCIRAYPDNDELAGALIRVTTMSESARKSMGKRARQGVLDNFTLERAASIWEKTFDELEVFSEEESWLSPPKFHKPIMQIPNLPNGDFIRWCIANIWGRPEMIFSSLSRQLIKALNYGTFVDGIDRGKQFNREIAVQLFLNFNHQWNEAESARYNRLVRQEQSQLEWSLV